MSGRVTLVVGSQCEVLNRLSFLPKAARELAAVLTDPERGACLPALPDNPVLHDPTAAELETVLEQAFRTAADQEATLVLAFIGHGVVVDGDDLYLMTTDSPATPDSRRALLLGQRIKELLRAHPLVDGLVLLLDTCGSGLAADRAGAAWIEVLRRAGRRFELLTATGDGSAAGGCFIKSLTFLLKTGRAQPVDRLGAAQLRGPINELCPQQVATWTGFDGTADLTASDDALWIGRNPEAGWLTAPLAGTAFAGAAYRLTAYYQPTDALAELRALITAGHQLIVVTGARHTGKSTLLAALTRPDLTGVQAPDHLMHAAVFPGAHYLAEQIAQEIADQLNRTVDDFADATARYRDRASDADWTAADAFERLVLGPLRTRGKAVDPVRIALDIDAAPAGFQGLLRFDSTVRLQVVLTCQEPPAGAQVLAISLPRDQEIMAYATTRGVPASAARELVAKASGNWMIATLLADQLAREPTSATSTGLAATFHAALRGAGAMAPASDVAPVLAVLAAAGHGAVLPLPLLRHAGATLGGPNTVPRVHEVLARLVGLVARSHAGTGAEAVGLVAPTVATYLEDQRIGGIAPELTHLALAGAIAALAPMTRHRPADPCHAYAARAEAEHLWRSGQHDEALRSLDERASTVHAANRDRWATWCERVSNELGSNHPLTIRATARLARWTAEAGDRPVALDLLARLLADSTSELGPAHRETLSIRDNIAFWTGLADPPAGLRQFAELVPDCVAHLGPDDPQTLTARHHLALMTSKCGDADTAIRMWEEILPLRERVRGAAHLDTLRTQQNLLYERAEHAYPPPVTFSFATLVATLRDTFGDDHPETITARYHEALFAAKTEERDRIAGALEMFRQLLPEAERVFGANNDVPNNIRAQLAFWPGKLADG